MNNILRKRILYIHVHIYMKALKKTKGESGAVIRGRTGNAIAKIKRTRNNKQCSTKQTTQTKKD